MTKQLIFAIPNHRPPPLLFLPGIYVFTNQKKKKMKEIRIKATKGKGRTDITNLE